MRVGCQQAAGFYLHIAASASMSELGEAIHVRWDTQTYLLFLFLYLWEHPLA